MQQGLMWLERAGELGNNDACKLLVDCYEKGSFDVPSDATRAARWRYRLDEYERLHPPSPYVRCSLQDFVSPSSIALALAIRGVTGVGYIEGDREINVSFDSALITPAELEQSCGPRESVLCPPLSTDRRHGIRKKRLQQTFASNDC